MKVEIYLRDRTNVNSDMPDHLFFYDVADINQDDSYVALIFEDGRVESFNHRYVERITIVPEDGDE